jgi:hypothetical protein
MLVVFDLDGTLANIEHRLGYVRSKPKNWRAFDAGIPNDAVNPYTAAVFNAMYNEGHDIVFASGRSEDTRSATVAWLEANGFWWPEAHPYKHTTEIGVKFTSHGRFRDFTSTMSMNDFEPVAEA